MSPYSYSMLSVWAVFSLFSFFAMSHAARRSTNLYKDTRNALLLVVFLSVAAAANLGTRSCLERDGDFCREYADDGFDPSVGARVGFFFFVVGVLGGPVGFVFYRARGTVQPQSGQVNLETGAGRNIADPSASQIAEELAALTGGGDSFAILSRDELTYIQAAGARTEGFVLEYQAGSIDQHYRSTDSNLPLPTVTDVFQRYAAEDSSWQSRTAWQRDDLG